MATFNQLLKQKNKQKKKFKIKKTPALEKCPQKRGICLKLIVKSPKKPNSALRKLAKLKLTNNLKIYAYIPGCGHSLQEYASVLVRGGRIKDLPGIKYCLIRNKLDLLGVKNRKSSRSKYGVKNFNKIKKFL